MFVCCLNSLKNVATRFSPGAEHQASVVSKNVGGLASWSAAQANSPNSGWVDQAWGAKLEG